MIYSELFNCNRRDVRTVFSTHSFGYFIVPRQPSPLPNTSLRLPDSIFVDPTEPLTKKERGNIVSRISILLTSKQLYLEASSFLYKDTAIALDLTTFGSSILDNLIFNISLFYRSREVFWRRSANGSKGFKARIFPLPLPQFENLEVILPVSHLRLSKTTRACPWAENIVEMLKSLCEFDVVTGGLGGGRGVKRGMLKLRFGPWSWSGRRKNSWKVDVFRIIRVFKAYHIFALLKKLAQTRRIEFEMSKGESMLWKMMRKEKEFTPFVRPHRVQPMLGRPSGYQGLKALQDLKELEEYGTKGTMSVCDYYGGDLGVRSGDLLE